MLIPVCKIYFSLQNLVSLHHWSASLASVIPTRLVVGSLEPIFSTSQLAADMQQALHNLPNMYVCTLSFESCNL